MVTMHGLALTVRRYLCSIPVDVTDAKVASVLARGVNAVIS